VVEVSGKSGEGLDTLVESLLLQADIMELRAAPEGQAEATVLDANLEKGRGVVADILVQVRVGLD
jgi:translation initiation factor IF-2